MSPSAQLITGQLEEIIENEQKTDKGAREVQNQVDNSKDDFDPDITSTLRSTDVDKINNDFELEWFDDMVGFMKASLIYQ